MFAHDLHVGLAVGAGVAMVAAALEAAWRALRGRPAGRFAGAASVAAIVVVGMTSAGGLALLAHGKRPKELLHVVYALLAFGLIPFADSFAARTGARRTAVTRLVASLLSLGVIARLFATG